MKTRYWLLLAFVITIIVMTFVQHVHGQQTYIRFKYGERCWPVGYEPHGKFKIYHDSIESCEKALEG